MNINEAKNELIQFFIKKDSINNEEFKNFCTKKITPTESEAALFFALQDFENKGFVCKYIGSNPDGKLLTTWVLTRPLIFNNQNLVIDGDIAFRVSSTVNSFYDSIGDKQSFSNPLEISKQDIEILLTIISMYASENSKESKKQEGQ